MQNNDQPPSASGERETLKKVGDLLGHIADVLPDEAFERIDTATWNAVSSLVGTVSLAPSPNVPSVPANLERINDLIGEMQHQPYGVGSRRKDAVALVVAALDQFRSAAPSPGIDAAEQKPICYLNPKVLDDSGQVCIREIRALTWSRTPQYGWTLPVFAAPPAAQPSADWLSEAERLAKELRNKAMAAGWGETNDGPADAAHEVLLAHLKARQ